MKRKLLILLLLPVFTDAQIITTFAGTGGAGFSGDGGVATTAQTPLPFSGAFDAAGNYYFSESAGAPRIRKISTSGTITTVAGNGIYGYSGDGLPATSAEIKNSFFDVDNRGNIFIADYNNNRIRKVDAVTGIIYTIAGNGTPSSTGDGGPATAATIIPGDLCVDRHGNLYVSESGGGIRKINTSGIISTIVPAMGGLGMCLDVKGHLYVGGNARIFKIDTATGQVDTIAGTGIATYNGDEIAATTANFKVYDLAVDDTGNLFLADQNDSRIRKIDTFGIIHTIAGTGTSGYGGDMGQATASEIFDPEGVAVDACGNIYIADLGNNRIRKVTVNSSCDPSESLGVRKTKTFNLPVLAITIYPNPATDFLHISSSDQIKNVTITNLIGQSVFCNYYHSEQVQIDVSSFPVGMYLVRINGTEVRKFVKQ